MKKAAAPKTNKSAAPSKPGAKTGSKPSTQKPTQGKFCAWIDLFVLHLYVYSHVCVGCQQVSLTNVCHQANTHNALIFPPTKPTSLDIVTNLVCFPSLHGYLQYLIRSFRSQRREESTGQTGRRCQEERRRFEEATQAGHREHQRSPGTCDEVRQVLVRIQPSA